MRVSCVQLPVRTFSTLHSTVAVVSSDQNVALELSPAKPGITMSSMVRRKPNCFNLLYQMTIMGKVTDQAEDSCHEI